MRIGVIETKQNALYDFLNSNPSQKSKARIKQLQREMEEQVLSLVEQALKEGCDILVTPEAINFAGKPEWAVCSVDELYETRVGGLEWRLSNLAKTYKSYIFAGVILKTLDPRGVTQLTNSCLVYDCAGKLIHIYDKIQLAGDENKYLTPGHHLGVVETEFGRIGICICYDMQFPELPRLLSAAGVRMIVCPTWGWEQIYGHARAYENGVYVAASMGIPYRGSIEGGRNPSEIVAPWGEVLGAADREKSDYVIVDIDIKACDEFRKSRFSERKIDLYGELSKCVYTEYGLETGSTKEIEELKQHIRVHYSENLTLGEMAKKAYMNPYYFSGFFKKKAGISFKTFLTDVRMEKAMEMVLTTDMRVYEISQSVGYRQTQQFVEKFREYYGDTPLHFRKNIMVI